MGKQFFRFWIWSNTERKSPAEYVLQHASAQVGFLNGKQMPLKISWSKVQEKLTDALASFLLYVYLGDSAKTSYKQRKPKANVVIVSLIEFPSIFQTKARSIIEDFSKQKFFFTKYFL